MNQLLALQGSPRRQIQRTTTSRCYLPTLADLAITAMGRVLERRGQQVIVQPTDSAVWVTGDERAIFALMSAVLVEAAGLSSARASLRLGFEVDDGDTVMTVIGTNIHQFPSNTMRVDPELVELAALVGAEIDLIWDQHEGPTLVLRFPDREANLA